MRFLILAVFALAFCTSVQAQQATHFVSPTGDDSAGGTSATTAWRTVQHAMNEAPPGATVEIADGTYFERVECNVSGTSGARTTFRAANKRRAILDGNSTGDADAILAIRDRSFVTIDGLTVTNNNQLDAQGILVEGGGDRIILRNNEIYGINFSDDPDDEASEDRNAQPLIVYGTSGEDPISSIEIDSNVIRNSRTGYSEGLALNGNVAGFRVTNNEVFDISNIGIDIIGHEGTAPANDQARNGLVGDNLVYRCNSAYAPAAGIYVDGGKQVYVERNKVFECDWGIEIGAEAVGETTSFVYVMSNVVYGNRDGGLQMGGFDYPTGSGLVTDCQVLGNTFFGNDTDENGPGGVTGELSLSANQLTYITSNIFYVNNSAGLALYAEVENFAPSLDYNLWYSSEPLEFEYGRTVYEGLADFQARTSNEANGLDLDPKFVDSNTGDFHITAESPARDAGNSPFRIDGTDIDGGSRIVNGRIDIGADEFEVTSPVPELGSVPPVRANVLEGTVRFTGLPDDARLIAYDRTGRRVARITGTNLDVTTWVSGLYFIRYTTADGGGTLPVVVN